MKSNYNVKHVLIVEDDINICNIYRMKLEMSGFDVTAAPNGFEAIHSLKLSVPDIILLDLKMPVMNGEEFLIRIRKIERYTYIPVVILTNISRTEAPMTMWHLNISAYVVKAHTTPKEIVDKVNIILKNEQ